MAMKHSERMHGGHTRVTAEARRADRVRVSQPKFGAVVVAAEMAVFAMATIGLAVLVFQEANGG